MKICFFNHYGYGDVHVSRTFINDIVKKLPNNEYYYLQNPKRTPHFILKDLKEISPSLPFSIDKLSPDSHISQISDLTFINTWYGQSNFKYFKITNECSFYVVYNIFKDVYEFLDLKIDSFENYLPVINYKNLEKKMIEIFFQEKKFRKYVLICNNPVLSGQSSNFDFEPIVEKLINLYDDIGFITTSKCLTSKGNLFSTSEIIELDFDLNEISYLSTKCEIVVGRSSGAYTFCLTKENLTNPNKKFVAFSNSEILALGLYPEDYKCGLKWSDDYSYDNILDKITQFI
jgi:hypothetical protein